MTAHAFFAPCPRGLEVALVAELMPLGATNLTPSEGGVAFEGPLELAYAANLQSRLASRILWRVGQGRYRDERDVHRLARDIDWTRHFRADRTLRVDVAAVRSPLTSLEFATLRIKDAIVDRFRDSVGTRPSVDKRAPDVRIHAFLTREEATFYLDTSGEPLFKRGYRRDAEAAPLRENLAAGLVALSGWQPDSAFCDPMCGSGTIAIEAALIAANRAPGAKRTFGFQKLAWYDGPAWQRLRQKALDSERAVPDAASIFASDNAPAAVSRTLAHARTAGVDAWLHAEQADVLERSAPASSGTLVANPPYGVRLSERKALEAFYPVLGDALKQRFAGWHAWLFTADMELAKRIRLRVERRIPLWNGALDCRLFSIPLLAGRHPSRDR